MTETTSTRTSPPGIRNPFSVVTESYPNLDLSSPVYTIVASGLTSSAALDLVDRIEAEWDDAAEGEDVPLEVTFACPDDYAASRYGRPM